MKRIKIVIADDHTLLCAGLKAMLNCVPELEVVGYASDGFTALRTVEQLTPDVLILDLSMKGMDGLDCIREIRQRGYSVKILVLTMYDEIEFVKDAMRAGADGYILKKSADTELIAGIKSVFAGKRYITEGLSDNLLSNLLKDPEKESNKQDPYSILSAREREVLRLLAQGYTNGEIGQALSLSVKTVDTYRSRMMQKLNINRRQELINYAFKHKLIDLGR